MRYAANKFDMSAEQAHVAEAVRGKGVAVLIPCYNEAITIGKVVDDFRAALPEAQIWVYDNNSTDDTARIAFEHGAFVRTEPRQGKGYVVRQMFRDIDAEYYVMVDGDDTYPAEAAPKSMVRKSPSWMGRSPGTPWGRLELGPATQMV